MVFIQLHAFGLQKGPLDAIAKMNKKFDLKQNACMWPLDVGNRKNENKKTKFLCFVFEGSPHTYCFLFMMPVDG